MLDNYLKNPEFINIVDLINKRNFLDANLKLDSLIFRDKDSYFLNNIKGVILLNCFIITIRNVKPIGTCSVKSSETSFI